MQRSARLTPAAAASRDWPRARRSRSAARCFVCGCNTDQQVAGAPDVPTDYRMRHPITLQESDRALELFIGTNRGELNPTQRAQVLAFGLGWKREATGGIVVDRPVGSSNERAAADAMREILSILAASGMPPHSIVVRTYPATGPASPPCASAIRRSPRRPDPAACGRRISGRRMNRDYFENQPPWNFGCATSAISPPWSTIRPTWCSRAARPPPTRCGAPRCWRNIARASDPSTPGFDGASSAKISDIGK